MKKETKRKLINAWIWCDQEDKSTEFMLQFIADIAHVSSDTATDFVMKYNRTPEDFKIYNRKKTYTRQEVFEILSEVAETLTYSEDPEVLIGNALDRIKKIAEKLE